MAEYGERLQQAEQYQTFSYMLLAKHVLKSDDQLFVADLKNGGPHFVIWEKQAEAEAFLAEKQATDSKLATYEVKTLPLNLIVDFVASNKDLSVLWHMSKGEQSSIPADAFLDLIGGITRSIEHEIECIKSPSLRDHVIQLLEGKRQLHIQITNADVQCPLTCPLCGHSFTLLEPAYRAWRDGAIEKATCNSCGKQFKEAPFATVPCAKCEKESGLMPPALCAYFTPANPYVCVDCQSEGVINRIQGRIEQRNAANQSGCLFLIVTLICSVVVMYCSQ